MTGRGRAIAAAAAVLLAAGVVSVATRAPEDDRAPSGGAAGTDSVAPPHGAVPPTPAGGDAAAASTEPVRARVSERFERLPATLRRPAATEVTAEVRAPLGETLVREGDAVEKGQVVARLLEAPWLREKEAAAAAGDAERLRRAEDALRRMEVRAPAAGLVYRVALSLGDPTFLGEKAMPILVLFDWKAIALEGTASAELADLLVPGRRVVVRYGGVGDRDGPGVVESREARPDGTVAFLVRPEAPPPALPEEGDGGAAVLVPVGKREILVVPRAAVRREGGRDVVDVVPVSGDPVVRPVTVGIVYEDGMVEVLEGLDRFESIRVPVRR